MTDPAGTVIDDGSEPLRYLHGGYYSIFTKLEAALDGKAVGDAVQVTLAPEDAYGLHDRGRVARIPRESFSRLPAIGDQIEQTSHGETLLYRVTDIDGSSVLLDANHPQVGMSLVFAATVMEIRPATAEEIAAVVATMKRAKAKAGAAARLVAETQADAEAAELAKAEAADLVETIYVKVSGIRIRLIFRSQTHKLCWLAPLFLLPALGIWLGVVGHEVAGGVFGGLWLAWTFFAPALIRMAIDRWGFRFLFFDFSPNPSPSRVENAIVVGGQIGSFLGALIYLAVALFHMEHASDLWGVLGATIAVLFLLVLMLTILLPFLVTILSVFRIRPIIDKVPAVQKG
ncbi:hypothetical protein CU669_18465 [Paramagnetospirillum kuznetsovii]|uniref:peptidylprolyl isomerase n=1 Tax=Paramagnetospirillum kuznetsovii TaxID=2053833 RepID=A0A364NTP2_9PROT|nr:hypothetical protein CU669_18465 [Paramagnetospirillum kuznetsovii]